MNKLIIMSLTIFAFGLVGCGKTDKEKCEAEGNEYKDGQCVEEEGDEMVHFIFTNKLTAAVTLSSGSNSLELAQDACAKVGEADFENLKVSTADSAGTTVAICDSADASNKCPEADDYEVVVKEGAAGQLNAVDQPEDHSACTELNPQDNDESEEYTMTNMLSSAVRLTAEGYNNFALASNVCIKLTKSQYEKLKVEKVVGNLVLCDNSDEATDNQCEEGNVLIKEDKINKAGSANANCTGALTESKESN